MVAFQTWPASLAPASIMYHVQPNVRMGPMLPNGKQNLVSGSTGYWIAETKYDIALQDEVRTYIAMIVKAGGGTKGFILPSNRTILTAPWPVGTGPTTVRGVVAFSGGQTIASGQSLVRPVIDIKFRYSVAAGATTATLVCSPRVTTINRGQEISYFDTSGAKRMAVIQDVPKSLGLEGNLPIYEINVSPAFRTDVRAYAQAVFEDTGCVMRLADPNTGQMTLESYLSGHPTIKWTEWWPDE